MIPPEQRIPLLLIWLGGYAVILIADVILYFLLVRPLLESRSQVDFSVGAILCLAEIALTAIAMWWWTVQAASYGQ